MKKPYGYYVSVGFIGFNPQTGKYLLFATEDEYVKWFKENENG